MRIRSLKPEFWSHEIMATLPEFTRLMAIGLLNLADDEGYFMASAAAVRGSLFPFVDDSGKITGALQELSNVGYLRLGKTEDGRAVGHVVKFLDHQVVNHAKPSKIKASARFTEDSGILPVTLLPGMEGNGRERNGPPPTPQGDSPSAQSELLDLQPTPPDLKPSSVPAKKEKGARSRNLLLDELVLAGGQTDLQHVTGPAWREAAAALKTIREVEPDLDPSIIRRAANAYRARWPNASLSPSALAKHWGAFRPAQKKEMGAPADRYSQPPGDDWRARFGYAEDAEWSVLPLNVRRNMHLDYSNPDPLP